MTFALYALAAFVCLVVFGFLAGVTGFKENWEKPTYVYEAQKTSSPVEFFLLGAAVFWPLSLLVLLVTGVTYGGAWVRKRIKEELKDDEVSK